MEAARCPPNSKALASLSTKRTGRWEAGAQLRSLSAAFPTDRQVKRPSAGKSGRLWREALLFFEAPPTEPRLPVSGVATSRLDLLKQPKEEGEERNSSQPGVLEASSDVFGTTELEKGSIVEMIRTLTEAHLWQQKQQTCWTQLSLMWWPSWWGLFHGSAHRGNSATGL